MGLLDSRLKGKHIMKEANKQIYDKEDRAEQQAKSIQCGPQLGQLTDLPYEPQTYLDHTPSTHKKPTGGNWQVYSRGSWSNRRHQRSGSFEGNHMPLSIIQQSSSRNSSGTATGNISIDLQQEASGRLRPYFVVLPMP